MSIINFSLFGKSNATIGLQPGHDNIFTQLYEGNLIKKPIVSFYGREIRGHVTGDGFLKFYINFFVKSQKHDSFVVFLQEIYMKSKIHPCIACKFKNQR